MALPKSERINKLQQMRHNAIELEYHSYWLATYSRQLQRKRWETKFKNLQDEMQYIIKQINDAIDKETKNE